MRVSEIVTPIHGALAHIRRGISGPKGPHARVTFVAFIGVMVGSTTAWLGFPPSALAATCNVHYNTVATNSDGLAYADHGVRASTGDLVYGGGVTCVHVDSVIVQSNDSLGDEAEVGWHTEATGYSTCHSTGDNTPHVMYTWVAYGQYECYEDDSISLSAGTYYPLSVRADLSDPNKSTYWIYDFNGSVITPEHDLGFKIGAGVTNGERHYLDPSDNSKESSQAHFKGMQYRKGTDVWSAWATAVCFSAYSNDPYYNNQLVSNTEVTVLDKLGQC